MGKEPFKQYADLMVKAEQQRRIKPPTPRSILWQKLYNRTFNLSTQSENFPDLVDEIQSIARGIQNGTIMNDLELEDAFNILGTEYPDDFE